MVDQSENPRKPDRLLEWGAVANGFGLVFALFLGQFMTGNRMTRSGGILVGALTLIGVAGTCWGIKRRSRRLMEVAFVGVLLLIELMVLRQLA